MKHDKLSCAARVAALDQVLSAIEGPVILAAHSAGVLIVAHWARRPSRRIKGALLATPPDIEKPLPPGYPTYAELQSNGWLPIPADALPFRSLLAASSDDPLASGASAAAMARDWGSELVALGEVGHLNPASGFGPWPDGLALLEALDRDLSA
jgi:predicted alpha/beta hydrolase family esterase